MVLYTAHFFCKEFLKNIYISMNEAQVQLGLSFIYNFQILLL